MYRKEMAESISSSIHLKSIYEDSLTIKTWIEAVYYVGLETEYITISWFISNSFLGWWPRNKIQRLR